MVDRYVQSQRTRFFDCAFLALCSNRDIIEFDGAIVVADGHTGLDTAFVCASEVEGRECDRVVYGSAQLTFILPYAICAALAGRGRGVVGKVDLCVLTTCS